jgi:hypothetical protein
MKRKLELREFTYGANQSEKKLIIQVEEGEKLEKPKSGVLQWLAKYSVLRKPRSYAGDRTNQSLRHLATTAKVYLDRQGVTGYQEVQAALTRKGNFIVSTNTNSGNRALGKAFEGLTLEQISEWAKETKTLRSKSGDADTFSRESRHVKKFTNIKRLQTAFDKRTKGTISIPGDIAKDGLHAEVRIRDAGGKDFDAHHVKGIKRPCAHCFVALGLPEPKGDGPGGGPGWTSDPPKLSGAKPSGARTRLSEKRKSKKATTGYDTESDSEAEDDSKAASKSKGSKSVLAPGAAPTGSASRAAKKQKTSLLSSVSTTAAGGSGSDSE